MFCQHNVVECRKFNVTLVLFLKFQLQKKTNMLHDQTMLHDQEELSRMSGMF